MKKLAGLAPFWVPFQKVAEHETRVMTLLWPQGGLPASGYAFVEFYRPAWPSLRDVQGQPGAAGPAGWQTNRKGIN